MTPIMRRLLAWFPLLAIAAGGCGVKLDPLPPLRPTPEDALLAPRPSPSPERD